LHTGQQERLFRQWVEQYQPILFRVARTYAASREDQEDLVQEMLLQLWRSAASFEGKAKPSTWIYRVALNTSFAWNRSQQRRRKHRCLTAADNVPDRSEDPASRANEAAVQQLRDAIRQLPVIDSSLAILHLEGLSYQEIADVLGITANNVGVKLSRIKKKLEELLKGSGYDA
jgi:RNA polymerase sigma-70 factor, ECF subfamily